MDLLDMGVRHHNNRKHEEIKSRKGVNFKRLSGTSLTIFTKALTAAETSLPPFGYPPNLSREDQLLRTLIY